MSDMEKYLMILGGGGREMGMSEKAFQKSWWLYVQVKLEFAR